MEENIEAPRKVTVIFDQAFKITAVPPVVQTFRDNHKIVWTLVSQIPGVGWAPKIGIVLKTSGAQSPYSNWPFGPAVPCEDDPAKYCAEAAPNPGQESVLYQYDINLALEGQNGHYSFRALGRGLDDRSMLMFTHDPDISNEPRP